MRLLVALALLAGETVWARAIPHEEFRARREALRKALPDGVTVLFGRAERDAEDLRSGFAQEPNFLYFTGWQEPGAILLVAPATGEAPAQEVLFLPDRNPDRERYTGRRVDAGDPDARAVTGFEEVLPVRSFESRLFRALEAYRRVYVLAGTAGAEKVRAMLPLRELSDATEAIGRLRLKKSAREIELIRRSVQVTIEAHRDVWRRLKPGLFEYQVVSTLVGGFLERGCERPAYTPIVGSGPNALVLHYSGIFRRMEAGELLLIDSAAECAGYAADITRTIPVSGKFTPRQRELYELVLQAQQAAIAAVKPGAYLRRGEPNNLTDLVRDYFDRHGKDLRGNPLGKYFTHGIGHHVGLEVHDAGKLLMAGPLEPGMVITVEPGLYIPEEGIGIRIEDVVLVTERGAEVLSASLPRDPDAIERELASRMAHGAIP
ncbi:MAG: Xaa-Pro peptidase family protein [Bryobacteraceae bacterium]|nr:Xaa-Pro peptidase family protein [Bryobacteraceae bacterium]